MKTFIKNSKNYWLISAVMSVAIMLLAMSYAQVLGGKLIFINYDLYSQVASFSKLFYKKLLEGSNLYYSFEAGMGMNTSLMFAFYVFSPVGILYALADASSVNIISIIIFLGKIGLSAALFQLFCKYNLKIKSMFTVVVSMGYALMSFTIYIHRMSVLYDAAYLLPLVLIAIKYLIDKKKMFPLTLVYFVLFLSNFYGGYIVGIVSFCYFLYYIILNRKTVRPFIVTVKYFVAVAIAFLLSAFILGPALYDALSQQSIEASNGFSSVPLWDIVFYMFPFHNSELYRSVPFIYIGVPAVLIAPGFFFNKKIEKRIKIVSVVVMACFFIMCTVQSVYWAAHMFNNPTGYTFRFSYVMAFFLGTIAVKAFEKADGIDYIKTLITDGVLMMLYLLGAASEFRQAEVKSGGILLTYLFVVIIVVLWFLLFKKYKNIIIAGETTQDTLHEKETKKNGINKNDRKKTDTKDSKGINADNIWIIVFFLLSIELCYNGYCMFGSSSFSLAASHNYHIQEGEEIISELSSADNSAYRVRYEASYNPNQGAFLGYKGTSLFSSSSNIDFKETLYNLGVESATKFIISEYGDTDLVELLLDEKYIVHGKQHYDTDEQVSVESNLNVAGMGFWVPRDIDCYSGNGNVFDNQNELYSILSGCDEGPFTLFADVFEYETDNVTLTVEGDKIWLERGEEKPDGYIIFKIPYIEGMQAYSWFDAGYNDHSSYSPLILSANDNIVTGYSDSYLSAPHIVQMSEEDGYFTVYMYFVGDGMTEVALENFCFAYYDPGYISETVDKLQKGSMAFDIFEDGHIKGSVTGTDEGYIFMSVPNEKGWTAFVDGNITEIVPMLNNAFIGIPVEAGQHTVELVFEAPYSRLGIILSMIGIGLFILVVVFDFISNKSKKGEVKADE